MVTSKDLIEFDVSVLGTQKLPWVRREPKYWRATKRIKAKTRGRKNNLITLIVTYFIFLFCARNILMTYDFGLSLLSFC